MATLLNINMKKTEKLTFTALFEKINKDFQNNININNDIQEQIPSS